MLLHKITQEHDEQLQSVLIIDNCHIHHNDALTELVNGAGEVLTLYLNLPQWLIVHISCLLLYLPPYCPNLDLIEESFSTCMSTSPRVLLDLYSCISTVKAYMHCHGTEMWAAEDPVQSLLEAYGCITAEMAQEWFVHARYQ